MYRNLNHNANFNHAITPLIHNLCVRQCLSRPPRTGIDGRSTFLGLCISRFIHPALRGRSSFVHYYFKRSSPKHSRLLAKVGQIYFILRSTQGFECSVRQKASNAAFDTRRRMQRSTQGVECTFVIFCSPIEQKDLC